MVEGRNVNLRIIEREDLPTLLEWNNDPEFIGEYEELGQETKTEWEKTYDNLTADTKWFFIEKKDGTRIGPCSTF